ncbi:MAG: MFS transporter [Chloroflexota bacterium]|nr:MFS transporter [Chloroflexota bacterium]MDE2910542.1 MFS transporter [Chloroflexota bacterium]
MILAIWNRSSFRIGVYRWYWLANVLVHITYLLQAVALGWHMLDVTGSPFQVGLVAFAYGLPLLAVAPIAGVVADRVKRQWVVQWSLAVAFLASAALALVAATGETTPLQILATSLILGATFSFYAPSRMALLPNLLPDDMAFNGVTLSYSGTRLMGFFGPVIAGFLLDLTDIATTLTVQAALYAAGAAIYLKATHFLPRPKRKPKEQNGILGGLKVVLQYLRGNKALFALTLLALVFVPMGMPYQKLMPVFVREALQEGPALLGLLVGSASLGSAVSGFAIAIIPDVYPKGKAILLFSGLFGLGLILFAFMSDPTIALVIIFIVGVFSGLFLTVINALLLTAMPDDMRGRMMSLWGMVWGLIPLTTLIGGTIAEVSGISIVYIAGGVCVAATCAFMVATRSPLLDL